MKLTQISILALLAAGIAGCGGSGDSKPQGRGRLPITVVWPVPSRLIPLASNSIVVSLVRADSTSIAQSLTITRPTTTVFFEGVPVGSYTVKAEAKPNADGTGTTQAAGTTASTINVVSGDNAPFAITMSSTVTQVRLGVGGASFLFKDTGGPNATLVSSTGVTSGSTSAFPIITGTTPITLEARNAADQLVLVNTSSLQLTASGDAVFDVNSPTTGDASSYSLTRNSSGPAILTAKYTDSSTVLTLKLPIYVVRAFPAPVNLAAAGAVDASATGVPTNGATPSFIPIDGTVTPATSAAAAAFASGFVAGDDIRSGATLGESVAAKVGSATVTYRKTTGAPDANDGVKTVTGVTAIYDVAAANGRILLLADVAAGRRIVEIPVVPVVGGSTVGVVISGDMAGGTDLAASAISGTTTAIAVQRTNKVERYGLTTVVLTPNTSFNALNIAGGRDIATTEDFTFVLDTAGRIHTYDLNGVEYALSLPLPTGTVGRRIAAAKNGSRTYLVATSTGLAGSEVSVFQEGS